ncbi:pickpocket protein 11-like [Lycorma delicatula]|uniref:pickpocket protein 11-like n=1 Tax=Lycorma delicatula TaxID=130591 RepID=UPI003F50E297
MLQLIAGLLPNRGGPQQQRRSIFWTACVLVGAAFALDLSLTTWYRYQENPTVISMERDYKEWNTSFPSVTVCPTVKVEDDQLQAFIDDNVSSSHSDVYGTNDLILSMTEVGFCYSYNSQVAIYNQPEYWKSGKFKIVEQPPSLTGSPLDGDMFAQLMGMSSGYTLYIHGPFETFDIATKKLSSEFMNYKTLELSGLSIYSTQEARSLSIKQRKCRFLDESNLVLSPAYSYKMCRTECRMKLAYKLCGCIPHFYKPQKHYKVCDATGIHCLGKHNELLIKLRDPSKDYEKVPCPCLPSCDDISYVVESETTMNWFLGTLLKWGLVKYPRLRLKRDIIFGFTDLLVAIGGTAGLFLGCSVLSFIEFFYFFTLNLICINWKKS